jgi:hypothetical protein
MSPELEEHYRQVRELRKPVYDMFAPLHPFVTMMLLSEVIAHWILEHPQKEQLRVLKALMFTSVEQLIEIQADDDETVH